MSERRLLLNTRDLSVGYGKNTLIPDITFSVEPGEILVLIGPNGAGKSTILKTISSQLSPISGAVFLDGKDMKELKDSDRAKQLSVLLTGRPDAERMTVEDVISSGRYPYTGFLGILGKTDKEKVRDAVKLVRLENEKDRPFDSISDGQKQRALLARAICQEPDVLILDEPTSFLDIRHKLELLAILKDLAKNGNIAIIMSLHELDLAQKCADHLLCVAGGEIDRYGTPEEIFARSDYIETLYMVEKGSFISEFGSVELEKPEGEPEVFIIGGGGSALDTYRSLARKGIPFACGIIHENDIEYPVARALAAEVITEQAFEPESEETVSRALEVMKKCGRVFCTVKHFGTLNKGCETLYNAAGEAGMLEETLTEEK